MGFVNEVALKEALTNCGRDEEFVREEIPWQAIEDRAREEIPLLVEADLTEIAADNANLPELRVRRPLCVEGVSPRLLTRVTAKLIQQYCRIRQDRVRDSNPDAVPAFCTTNSA